MFVNGTWILYIELRLGRLHVGYCATWSMIRNQTGERKVIVCGTPYTITPQIYDLMKYFAEAEAIQKTDTHTINVFDNETWIQLLGILESLNYDIPPLPPRITTNDPRDVIGAILS